MGSVGTFLGTLHRRITEDCAHRIPLRRCEVTVSLSRNNGLVSEQVLDGKDRHPCLNQSADICVSEILESGRRNQRPISCIQPVVRGLECALPSAT